MNAAELLDSNAVLTCTQVAEILQLRHRSGAKKGMADRRLVLELVAAGKLRLVDPDQPTHRYTIATSEVRRYLNGAAA